jgi:uncharacterized membrane protein YkgB
MKQRIEIIIGIILLVGVLMALAGCGTTVSSTTTAAVTTSSGLIMASEYMKTFKITITNQ